MNSSQQNITKKKRNALSRTNNVGGNNNSNNSHNELPSHPNNNNSSSSKYNHNEISNNNNNHRRLVTPKEKADFNARLEERRKQRRDQRIHRKRRKDVHRSLLGDPKGNHNYFRSKYALVFGLGFGLVLLGWILTFLYLAKDLDFLENSSKNHLSPSELKNRWKNLKTSLRFPNKKTPKEQHETRIFDERAPLLKGDPTNIVDMRILNQELPFADENGGVWTQGWDVQPVSLEDPEKPLRVFVVPHSHCDPGWIKTFDEYFQKQTRGILTSVVEALLKDKRRKFIWAEISYFEWWWKEQSIERQNEFRTLLREKRFEFVTGGWVQPDEANTQLYAMEIQLEEGHDFLRRTFGDEFIPKYGWSIDPFGYSPTMAYLLKKHGFRAMLIQRVHYAIKKELALHKNLEFMWRQTWDNSGDFDIFAHVMPFFSYDVPHTCGPDPSICCQFDFARYTPEGSFNYIGECPWGEQPQLITDENVKERATMILDQYRKKANLYRTNVVIAPLGDDFRYRKVHEADLQYDNYQKLFDYINLNVDNVEISFGTLSEYFETIMADRPFSPPLLKGSFFTYADREQDYWSGYYTSRIFDKALDRQLERVLYAASSMGATKEELQGPRRALSLFQHHDGVTGTAKHKVVEDYAKRIHSAIGEVQDWILRHLFADPTQDHGRSQDLAKKLKVQACWQSNAPRGLSQNLCEEGGNPNIIVYNPLPTEQSCGDTVVPGRSISHAKLPCETPGTITPTIRFDPHTGLMTHPIREEWMVWKVTKGGAYLFFPGSLNEYQSMGLEIHNGGAVVTTKGWNRTVVERRIPKDGDTEQIVIDFVYTTNLTVNNDEWFARFTKEDIHNDGIFHTDLNGYNFDTHRFRSDMPIQSQVFPMPTLASIEDEKQRMTILSEHAQGTASLEEGSIDVWLDRRLAQDDGRGLDQGFRDKDIGVKDNVPTRTRLRVVLEERSLTTPPTEFEITPFCKNQWKELNHPLEMYGSVGSTGSNSLFNRLRGIPDITAIALDNRSMEEKKASKDVDLAESFVKDSAHGASNIVSVYMVYKRVDYLKQAIESLLDSDYPKSMPIVISHDGHVPEVVNYVKELQSGDNGRKIVQLFHPYSCYDHPGSFPSDDPKLNENYSGDTYGNKREGSITCCKHHFVWLMNRVFGMKELSNIDGFLFMEEDYIVAPTLYKTIHKGFKYIDETNRREEFFALTLDPTDGYAYKLPKKADWIESKFVTGPMAIRRDMFARLKLYSEKFCEWDDYNWDWSIVHLMALNYLPFRILSPGTLQAAHIGLEGGMHEGANADAKKKAIMDLYVIDGKLEGFHKDVGTPHIQKIDAPSVKTKGFGGWGHPEDQKHCKQLFKGEA